MGTDLPTNYNAKTNISDVEQIKYEIIQTQTRGTNNIK